jgi:hypothetical protein
MHQAGLSPRMYGHFIDEAISEPNFAEWLMGFELLHEEQYRQIPGWFQLDERFLDVM